MGWMELKDPQRAWGLLERSFANITEPFKVSLSVASTYTLTTPASYQGPSWWVWKLSLRGSQP